MATHTPGPWTFDASGGYVTADTADGTVRIADIPDCRDIPYPSDAVLTAIRTQAANARLIAAAPELLAALHEATRYLAWHVAKHRGAGMGAEVISAARDAIAKAEGTDT